MQELVVESLVVSLAMVVVDVLAHEETHVPFAEGDDATEDAFVVGMVARYHPIKDHDNFLEAAKRIRSPARLGVPFLQEVLPNPC